MVISHLCNCVWQTSLCACDTTFSYWHCTENHIFFFQTSWKDGLSRKIVLEYNLSYRNIIFIIGKMIFLFLENIILHLRGKRKMTFPKKYTKIWHFLQTFWKDGLSRKGCIGTWSFSYYLEKRYFFPENMIFFQIHGNMIHCPTAKKNRKPNILDWSLTYS